MSRAYGFKQLCEQSDANLRQYLGKPLNPKQAKQQEEVNQQVDLYHSSLLLSGFGLDDSSNDSDDDSFTNEFPLLETGTSDTVNDEKIIAQKQLLKAAKMQKYKGSKKKLLAKNGGKATGKYYFWTIQCVPHLVCIHQ